MSIHDASYCAWCKKENKRKASSFCSRKCHVAFFRANPPALRVDKNSFEQVYREYLKTNYLARKKKSIEHLMQLLETEQNKMIAKVNHLEQMRLQLEQQLKKLN